MERSSLVMFGLIHHEQCNAIFCAVSEQCQTALESAVGAGSRVNVPASMQIIEVFHVFSQNS